jgi:hypothetical protein
MSDCQCWSMRAEGVRCAEAAQPGSFFCRRHWHIGATDAARVWLAPEAEMPRELVSALRRADPAITFPAPETSVASETMARSADSGTPSAPAQSAAAPTPLGSSLPTEESTAPLDWLLLVLRAATEGVMAGEATPLQKANAVSRLAGQYLKAYGAQERERENKALRRRLAGAEARVTALEARLASEQSHPLPALEEAVLSVASRQPEPERSHLLDETGMVLNAGEPPDLRPTEGQRLSLAGAADEATCAPP